MGRLASIATGNFTAAATWGLIDATLYANSETSTVVCPTAYSNVARSAQQTPGAITVSHIGVKLSVRTGITGTITVHIADGSHVEVAGTAVTINTADLPEAATADLNGGWHFFKLTAPVTLAGATLYEVEALTSNASQISLFASAATNGLSCALITTTTQAPAAGDDLIVCGEYTGAGTSNSFVVTMNETATTDYGAGSTSLVTPALAICNKGTLTWGTTAATNYYLKLSGNLIEYSGGTHNRGTTGTPCPRDSTMKLQFDVATTVEFGRVTRNLATVSEQGLSRTSGKDFYYCLLNTDEAINSTSLGVDTDTGWLDNDQIAVASTTRTTTDCEDGTLNGNAGASSLTVDGFLGVGGGLASAHSGTSPTQAEIILLTRNVSMFGTSTTLVTYWDIKGTANVDCDWAEYYWMGHTTANKRGVDIATTTGSCSFVHCSRHTTTSGNPLGFNVTAISGSITLSNNVVYRCGDNAFVIAPTSGSHTITGNIAMKTNTAVAMYILGDAGSTYTNNRAIGAGLYGFQFNSEASTFNLAGNIAHSCGSYGFWFSSSGGTQVIGTINGGTSWRNGAYGIGFVIGGGFMTISNFTLFGNTTGSIFLTGDYLFELCLDTVISNGDTSFSTTNGITITNAKAFTYIKLLSCNFSTVSGIKTAHTNDINLTTTAAVQILASNTIFAAASEVTNPSNMLPTSYIASQKNDQTAGNHKVYKKYGLISRDTTTPRTGVECMKLTPSNASNKLESTGPFGGFKIPVLSGQTVTASIYVQEDASYNGNRARFMVRRNDALGILVETVLDTATAASDGAYELLTGSIATSGDEGTVELYVDCDGTAGNLFIDDLSVVIS